MFTLGLNCLIIGIELLSHQVVTQYLERLNQPAPPLERSRGVVRGQQFNPRNPISDPFNAALKRPMQKENP